MKGKAPGLKPGTTVDIRWKLGGNAAEASSKSFSSAGTTKVDKNGEISWSRLMPKGQKNAVAVVTLAVADPITAEVFSSKPSTSTPAK